MTAANQKFPLTALAVVSCLAVVSVVALIWTRETSGKPSLIENDKLDAAAQLVIQKLRSVSRLKSRLHSKARTEMLADGLRELHTAHQPSSVQPSAVSDIGDVDADVDRLRAVLKLSPSSLTADTQGTGLDASLIPTPSSDLGDFSPAALSSFVRHLPSVELADPEGPTPQPRAFPSLLEVGASSPQWSSPR
eukprot:CAMPEP_0113670206 /NCGR_PEP_ID=MMETSP0038_2-20120614/5006_1 /TAXON_ID=2898 /ORGANISM="Cryptomonas paramecium" /LENGTH=191 /DNA_ID=CAMNT_0000586193 /DNA_START=25 /DNA_END=596 /DNA_ORIENTATION=+ /assembly_acc=CAM_ASM_000170